MIDRFVYMYINSFCITHLYFFVRRKSADETQIAGNFLNVSTNKSCFSHIRLNGVGIALTIQGRFHNFPPLRKVE